MLDQARHGFNFQVFFWLLCCSISDRCWWARKAWPSLLLPCVVAMLKGSKNCTTTCLLLKCSASNQAMRDLAFTSPPHACARLLIGKASSFPPENRFRSLRRVSAWRGCFRFLYHIIKLRQVLNNFSSLRRRGRFSWEEGERGRGGVRDSWRRYDIGRAPKKASNFFFAIFNINKDIYRDLCC